LKNKIMPEEFISKYELIDCLKQYIKTGWTERQCPLPCRYAKYIQVIINILTATASMSSNPQFIELFQQVCDELEIDLKKYK